MNDTISRQATITEMEEYWRSLNLRRKRIPLAAEAVYMDLKGVVFTLPSAQPKTGKWTEKEVIYAEEAKEIITEWQSCKCSVCGRYHTQPYMYYFNEPRFCSYCGADMKGEEDETD